jgi:hypothetical protein
MIGFLWRDTMKKISRSGKIRSTRRPVKKQKQPKRREKTLEREYQQTFSPHPLPYQGLYSEEDSLEQPSALKSVPTRATPGAQTDGVFQTRHDAELERSIH